MAFRKMTQPAFPPRMWSLVGYPGSGKSSFAAQMRGPMLVVDADHRFTEVLSIVQGDVYSLSDKPADNVDPDAIAQHLQKNMPGSDVKTIVVDSLTAIIAPLVVQAMLDKDAGRSKNLIASFRGKALAMRQLQDAVTRWGSDVLWIYHLQDSRDDKAKEITRTTISRTEIARLTRSINLQLQIVQEGERRGIKVLWARRGRSDIPILWDDTGCWKGMPTKIEEAVYADLSPEEQAQIEKALPEVFPNPETAISWAFEQGAFTEVERARSLYDKLKKEKKPRSAKKMAELWIEAIQQRIQAMARPEFEALENDSEAPTEETPF